MKLAGVLLAFFAFAAPVRAATVDAGIQDFSFNPSAITVDQNDGVRWTNNGASGHTVAINGVPASPVLGNGDAFTHLFDSAGSFPFHCTIHPTMTGAVKVIGPTAHATASKKMVVTNATVTFDGSGSTYNGDTGSIASYEWDLGDSTTDSGVTVTHAFTTPDVYDVVLTVTDTKGATDTGTVRVTAEPTAIAIANAGRVREGDSGTRRAKFIVTLSNPSSLTTTVHFATVHGTARAPGDYKAKSGTLTFLPGAVQKTIVVYVKGDLRAEPNETFRVRLSSPTNAVVADSRGGATIVDDD
jgi:plastocyanin